jgi:hypothetical protein
MNLGLIPLLCNLPIKGRPHDNFKKKIRTTKFPWAEPIIREDGKMYHVKCQICIKVQNRKKLLVPKFDGLHKHSGRWKCKHAKLGEKVGDYYTNFDTQHARNSCIYGIIGPNPMIDQMVNVERA